MVRWADKLYLGENIKKKQERVIAAINNREAIYGVYCIAFASQACNLFDIMDVNELLFPHYKRSEIHIVGLAKGRDEAIELVHDMLMEVYKTTGDFDVRTYFT